MSSPIKSPLSDHSFSKTVLAKAIAAAVGVTASGGLLAQEERVTLDEIVVTARQHSESSQDVPMMITALTGDDLKKRGVTTLEDFARFAPGLSTQATTPGSNTIVFRGVSDGGGFLVDPTAAFYLDEQPMSQTSVAPDIYPVDLARIEALAGPQSTLFGASSQSGAVRIITNKPNLSEFETNIGVEYSSTDKGEPGYKFDATVNIPIIEDKFAVRLSGFSATDGGYIDNVLGIAVDTWRDGDGVRDNANVLEDDINPIDWVGFRGHARWQINDDWMATLSYNHQKIEAGSYNDYDPNVGDLETVLFINEVSTDEFDQMSLVIEADLGFANLVSATSYYDRDIYYQYDAQAYVSYASGWGDWYDFGLDAIGGAHEPATHDAFAQEIRLSGSSDTLQWTAGLFYQEANDSYVFNTYVEDYRNSLSFDTRSAYYGGLDPTDSWWESGQDSTREETAVFGELNYSVTDSIDIILGARWYDVDIERTYYIANPSTGPITVIPSVGNDDGFVPKLGLQYNVNDDVMLFALYSEGFRPGGGNRARNAQTLPLTYESDILENSEIGLKSTWFDDRLQVNASIYQMAWDNTQVQIVDPAQAYFGQTFVWVVANLGDAEVDGFDLDVTALLGEHLRVGFNMNKITKSELTAITSVPDARATGAVFEALVIEEGFDFVEGQVPTGLQPVQDLPLFADRSWSTYIEYNLDLNWFGGGNVYVRLQHSDTGESINKVDDHWLAPKETLDGYAITDLKFGYDTADWSVQFFINNLDDERGITFKDNWVG
ncbi:MAG: TonB-dependent receptor, partial [Chloroflexi bacterium]